RSFANNEEDGVLILCAIPMHLLAEMGHKGAGRHGNRVRGIEYVAGAHPPGSLEHGDEAVVWMKMRPAEIVACEPFVQNDIEARLFRIADQYRSAAATGTRPRDLIR